MDYANESHKAGLSWEEVNGYRALLEVQNLRYKVYCVGRGYETAPGIFEADLHDEFSRHVLVRLHGKPVATTRFVPINIITPTPMYEILEHSNYSPNNLLSHLPRYGASEISRFTVLSPEMDETGELSDASVRSLVRATLLSGMVGISFQHNITHWTALMEPALQRLLAGCSVRFNRLTVDEGGEQKPIMVEHKGLRHALWANRDITLSKIYREQPDLWSYFVGSYA